MQLMQLWKECFKNLGLPGFLTLSLLLQDDLMNFLVSGASFLGGKAAKQ